MVCFRLAAPGALTVCSPICCPMSSSRPFTHKSISRGSPIGTTPLHISWSCPYSYARATGRMGLDHRAGRRLRTIQRTPARGQSPGDTTACFRVALPTKSMGVDTYGSPTSPTACRIRLLSLRFWQATAARTADESSLGHDWLSRDQMTWNDLSPCAKGARISNDQTGPLPLTALCAAARGWPACWDRRGTITSLGRTALRASMATACQQAPTPSPATIRAVYGSLAPMVTWHGIRTRQISTSGVSLVLGRMILLLSFGGSFHDEKMPVVWRISGPGTPDPSTRRFRLDHRRAWQ